MEEMIDHISEADMPNEDMRMVFSECGASVALSLLEKFEGMKIYIPSNGFRRIKNKMIIKHADEMTPMQLAMKFKVPLSTVYNLLKVQHKDAKQTSFLDEEKHDRGN